MAYENCCVSHINGHKVKDCEAHQKIDQKQNKLIAGANITIDEQTNTISAEGCSGTTNYNELQNKPSINGNTLTGNIELPTKAEVDEAKKLTEENAYTTSAIIAANNIGLDLLVVEPFKDVTCIDQTLLDGATVVSQYWQANKHAIIKTSNDTLSIESTLFNVSDTPYKAWINLDYTGTGSVTAYFSKNNGEDWTQLTNNQVTNINMLVQKKIRIKLDLVGVVTLKNLAWGVM